MYEMNVQTETTSTNLVIVCVHGLAGWDSHHAGAEGACCGPTLLSGVIDRLGGVTPVMGVLVLLYYSAFGINCLFFSRDFLWSGGGGGGA